MNNDPSHAAPIDEPSRIESEAATEILRMLTSASPEPSIYDAGDGQAAQRSVRQETTMWF